MNFIALCSSALLLLSLITCSQLDNKFDNDFEKDLGRKNIDARQKDSYSKTVPVLKSKDIVDDPAKNSEYTRLLVWYMIPEEVRGEILYKYYYSKPREAIIYRRPPPEMVSISTRRYFDIEPEVFATEIRKDYDWVDLSNEYVLNSKRYSERTQLSFLVEAIKNSLPSKIEEILKRRPLALVLLKKIQAKASEELVKFVLNSRKSGSEIIEIFRILERYSDLDMANLSYLQNIRNIAFERDDCELLMYTNAYPDLIKPSSACSLELFDHLKDYKLPEIWDLVCANPHKSEQSWMFKSSKKIFKKFQLFSNPVLVDCWTLDMYALACQDYERAFNIPLRIVEKHRIVTEITSELCHIAQMIPFIPDQLYREKFIEKYNLRGKVRPETYLTEFPHLNSSGAKCTVRVIPYCQQEDIVCSYTPPVRVADTNALVSKVLVQLKK